jgi:cytochrome c oxidase subunit 2
VTAAAVIGAGRTVTDTRGTYDSLAALYVPVAAVVFGLVLLALVVVAVRFRAGRGHAPSRRSHSPRLEIAYAVVLGVISGVLVWRSYVALSEADPLPAQAAGDPHPSARQPSLTIAIAASRWNWRFTYPRGVVQTGDGHTRYPVLVVPDREPVRFRLTSLDVIHALWFPALRAKYDAVPGRTNIFDLAFERRLDYSTVRCSEFCGDYHDQMRVRVDVRPRAAFDAWLRNRQAAAG